MRRLSSRLPVLLWVDRLHLVAQCWPPTALLLCSQLQFRERGVTH